MSALGRAAASDEEGVPRAARSHSAPPTQMWALDLPWWPPNAATLLRRAVARARRVRCARPNARSPKPAVARGAEVWSQPTRQQCSPRCSRRLSRRIKGNPVGRGRRPWHTRPLWRAWSAPRVAPSSCPFSGTRHARGALVARSCGGLGSRCSGRDPVSEGCKSSGIDNFGEFYFSARSRTKEGRNMETRATQHTRRVERRREPSPAPQAHAQMHAHTRGGMW